MSARSALCQHRAAAPSYCRLCLQGRGRQGWADGSAASCLVYKATGKLNTTSAIMMFLKQCHRNQGLPFVASMLAPEPNIELMEALKEADEIRNGKKKVKGYRNMEALKKALDE